MKNSIRWKILAAVCLILLATFLSSCSMFDSSTKIGPPEVEFAGGGLDRLSFSSANFLFNLKIRNPNPLGIRLAGFDYDFLINNSSFFKGQQDRGLEIAAKGESTVQVPVSVGFLDLYQAFQSLVNQDRSTYQINCGFSFNVPVLGVVSVPVSKTGDFPLPKLPKVDIDFLRLRNLSISGAELILRIKLENPNAFSMVLERLRYDFEVNDTRWISGDAQENVQIAEKGEGFVDTTISLSFIEMGRSVYQLIDGDRSLNYRFGGDANIMTSIPLLGQVSLPFDRSGQIRILR